MSNEALVEFLLTRYAEDEYDAAAARQLVASGQTDIPFPAADPDRVLADLESKRRIVQGMVPYGPLDDLSAPEVFALLALPYVDHPDYRDEWKP